MFAQYSPLFTSGLRVLADPASSRDAEEPAAPAAAAPPFKRRKRAVASIPHTARSHSAHSSAASFAGVVRTADADAPFLFTLAPRRRPSARPEYSFLSLDLADARSDRSMSLRRKDTVSTRRTSFFAREPASPEPFSPLSQPLPPLVAPTPSPTPTLRRASREALRLPSPKPAPSTRLPRPPLPPLPAHRTLSLSTDASPVSPVSASSSEARYPPAALHRPSRSAPSLLPPVRTSPLLSPELSCFLASPVSPLSPPGTALTMASDVAPASPTLPTPASPTPRSPSPERSYLTFSSPPQSQAAPPRRAALHARPSVGSTASGRTRQLNRSAALAALEGRGRSASPARRASNFMSMSDDEDEDLAAGLREDLAAGLREDLAAVLREEEDVVVPRADAWSAGGARGTLESLLSPLANFMDLSDSECGGARWRSFIEISS